MVRRPRKRTHLSSDSDRLRGRLRGKSKRSVSSKSSRKTRLWKWLPAIGLLLALAWSVHEHRVRRPSAAGDVRTASDQDDSTEVVRHHEGGWELLRTAAHRYRELASYADQARLVFCHEGPEGHVQEVTDLWIKFARPNKLWVEVVHPPTRVRLGVDGKLARVWVDDPATHDFDRQLVERPAPTELTLPFVHSVTEYVEPSDPQKLQSLLMGLRIPFEISPLGMLLSPETFDQFVEMALSVRELPVQTAFGISCRRIELVANHGTFVFWIDANQQALRRIEYPVTGHAKGSASDNVDIPPVSLRLDLPRVEFNPRLAGQDCHLPLPTTAQCVRHLVLPPDSQIPSCLGKQVPSFRFTDLQDREIGSADWPNAYLVLTWFGNHPQSLATLQQMDTVHTRYQNDPNVRVIAVCSEPSTRMSHTDVEQLASRWKLRSPVVRDLDAVGRDLFSIDRVPTLIVLSPQREVQLFEVGGSPQMAEQVPQVIEQLRHGHDIAGNYIAYLQRQKQQYQRMVAAASVNAPPIPVAVNANVIAEPSQPQRLRLTQRWHCEQLRDPGNIAVIAVPDGEQTLLVHDGWREIVELTMRGQVASRHRLDVPPDAAIQSLRSGVDRQGDRYFVATSRGARQLYVFDHQWQLIGRYPEDGTAHDGIADVRIDDLDSDGSLELYVALAGKQGVHRIDLRGNLLWKRAVDAELLSFAISRTSRALLATHSSGSLLPLSHEGQFQSAIAVGGRAVFQLTTQAADHSRPTAYCGISHGLDGRNVAIGLDDQLLERWNYPLPIGQHGNQVCSVQSVQLLPEDEAWQWLLAGADGSIHVVADDGGFHDHFNCGAELTGLAVARVAEQAVLVVATPRGVTAWRVQQRAP